MAILQEILRELSGAATTRKVESNFDSLGSAPITTQGGTKLNLSGEYKADTLDTIPLVFRVLLDGAEIGRVRIEPDGVEGFEGSYRINGVDVVAGAHQVDLEWAKVEGSPNGSPMTIDAAGGGYARFRIQEVG